MQSCTGLYARQSRMWAKAHAERLGFTALRDGMLQTALASAAYGIPTHSVEMLVEGAAMRRTLRVEFGHG